MLPGLPADTDTSLFFPQQAQRVPSWAVLGLDHTYSPSGQEGRWILVLGVGGRLMDKKPQQESPCKGADASF